MEHKDDTKIVSQAKESAFNATFYADCRHELKKIESGYRLCVVCNLGKVGGGGTHPSAKSNKGLVRDLRAVAKVWSKKFNGNML